MGRRYENDEVKVEYSRIYDSVVYGSAICSVHCNQCSYVGTEYRPYTSCTDIHNIVTSSETQTLVRDLSVDVVISNEEVAGESNPPLHSLSRLAPP